jgi:hypothetical protein
MKARLVGAECRLSGVLRLAGGSGGEIGNQPYESVTRTFGFG